MAKKTAIQWTDATWNPWHGCHKISAGCKYCYMFRDKERYGQNGDIIKRSSKVIFNAPLTWQNTLTKRVFTCSWSDFFIEKADAWRHDAWAIIRDTPNLQYQILTKRPSRIWGCLPFSYTQNNLDDDTYIPDNVMIGISVENPNNLLVRMTELVPLLNKFPKTKWFISFEPLLELVSLDWILNNKAWPKPDWVIIGGESGNETGNHKYRPCEIYWIEKLVMQCQVFNIPVFVKQLGSHLAKEHGFKDSHGGNWDEWDAISSNFLRIREYPK